jgi:hypothetical protein
MVYIMESHGDLVPFNLFKKLVSTYIRGVVQLLTYSLPLRQYGQYSSGAHPPSYPIGTRGCFRGSKEDGA